MERERGAERGGIPDGLLVGLLGFLLGVTILVWTATGLAGLLAHGAWPDGVTFGGTPSAMRGLVSQPHDLVAAWPATPPAQLSGYGLFWGLFIGELMVLVVLAVFVLGTLARWRAVRTARRHGRTYGYEDRGTGPAEEPVPPRPSAYDSGRTDAPRRTPAGPPPRSSRPHTPPTAPAAAQGPATALADGTGTGADAPPAETAEPMATAQTAKAVETAKAMAAVGAAARVPAPRTAGVVLYGADPAARRPTALQAVLDAAGPALVLTSDPTVWADTKDARAKLGPVLVYDPGHLCDTPARLHWSPTAGCEDTGTAATRAAALLAPVRPPARIDAAVADTADTLMRCWLHAAAVDGRPFKQVHRWAQNQGSHEPVRILRTHPKATNSHAGLLESALTAYPERREIAQELTVRALSSLSSVHIREACTPNRTDSLTLESFIHEGGTLYVVGEAIEDPRTRPGAMPLLTALASYVVEHGRRMAARSSDGRLDPPMTLVLDDVAAVAPLPLLPELLASGQDAGMPTLALLRSAEQGRARWPDRPLTPLTG
ncbi:type VI secretion protein [Streptomyces sp. NPDC051310]|uniref:type VI secretion protein n=1 Tax=Streptomyces sp. NPDC051310 TaxID=3365649 RepID=UPI00379C7153